MDTTTSPSAAAVEDWLIFGPDDVDLARSPLRGSFSDETYVLGAFNPGFARLPNGNLLMMVRVAEALREPVFAEHARAIRWREGTRYAVDAYPLASVNMKDPRHFQLTAYHYKVLALTSLSWLLPVELSADARRIVAIHYDRIIAPAASYQQYGVEDARITCIEGRYYMTTCSVGAERHCTSLYVSDNGLDYSLRGIVLDHQNKDMVLFEGKVGGKFCALTRPLGDVYFTYAPDSEFLAGPCMHLAHSPDALHWKPFDKPGIRARKGSTSSMKIGGGAQPILTDRGWLTIYHGVETRGLVGLYRTFWALLDRDDPSIVLRQQDQTPLLEARPDLTAPLRDKMYVHDVVFTTGIQDDGAHYLLASGEADLACRISRLPKARLL